MNDEAIAHVTAAISKCQELPYSEENSYICWTLNEILSQLMDHPWVPALDTVWNFELLFRLYVTTAVTDQQRLIFSTAADTAAKLFTILKEAEC